MAAVPSVSRRGLLQGAAGAASVLVSGASLGAGPAYAAARRLPMRSAHPAESLASSVGVVTHFSYGRSEYAHTSRVVAALDDLGVRHVRNRIGPSRRTRLGFKALTELGVRVNGVCGMYGDPQTMEQVLHEVVSQYDDPMRTFSAFEGINEPNNNGRPWIDETRAQTRDLFLQRLRFGLTEVPIVSPAMARVVSGGAEGGDTGRQSHNLGDLTEFVDYGNIHVYPRALPPSSDIDEYMRYQRAITGDLPMFCTEGGYFNAMKYAGGAYPTPERVAGKYLPQQIMEHWIRGNVRFFTYELLDDHDPSYRDREAHFGLLGVERTRRGSRWHPKPQYEALKNFVSILSDRGGRHDVGGLPMHLEGPRDLRSELVAKRNGARYLLLWRDQKCYEPETRRKVEVSSSTVTLTLESRHRVKLFYPSQSRSAAKKYDGVSSLKVPVSDELIIVKIV